MNQQILVNGQGQMVNIRYNEVLLSVQELTRLKDRMASKFIEMGSLSQDMDVASMASQCETIQSWASLLEDQMSALRLEKLYASVVSTITIGVSYNTVV